MAWPAEWDRGSVLGAIEEASGIALNAEDQLPDTLIAKAQELGLKPLDLKLWIYDSPHVGWSPAELTRWARRSGLAASPEGEAAERHEQNASAEVVSSLPNVVVLRIGSCPFYGRHLAFAHTADRKYAALVDQCGNQCALITSSYAPCSMQINGAEPAWGLCLRNPDNNGTGVSR